jgi:hypothetical protein
MKTNPYENHRNRHMTAQDIQNEIELLRRTAAQRGPLNRRRIAREDLALWGFAAIACIVPAIAAVMLILL